MNKPLTTLAMLTLAGAAAAQVTALRVTQTDNGGIADDYADLAGTVTNDLSIDFTGLLGNQQLVIELQTGSLFRHPLLGADSPPNPVFLDLAPTVEFDSFVAAGSLVTTAALPIEVVGGAVNVGAPIAPPTAGPHPIGDYSGNGVVGYEDVNLRSLYWGQPTPPIPPGWDGDPPDGTIDNGEKVEGNWGFGSNGPYLGLDSLGGDSASLAWTIGRGVYVADQTDFPVARITLSGDARGQLHFFGSTLDDSTPFRETLPIARGIVGFEVRVEGDFNDDLRVDNADLNLLLGAWGSTVDPPWCNGFTCPIDNGELNALLGNWGFGTGATAVPEPVSFATVLLTFTGAHSVRRRR